MDRFPNLWVTKTEQQTYKILHSTITSDKIKEVVKVQKMPASSGFGAEI